MLINYNPVLGSASIASYADRFDEPHVYDEPLWSAAVAESAKFTSSQFPESSSVFTLSMVFVQCLLILTINSVFL